MTASIRSTPTITTSSCRRLPVHRVTCPLSFLRYVRRHTSHSLVGLFLTVSKYPTLIRTLAIHISRTLAVVDLPSDQSVFDSVSRESVLSSYRCIRHRIRSVVLDDIVTFGVHDRGQFDLYLGFRQFSFNLFDSCSEQSSHCNNRSVHSIEVNHLPLIETTSLHRTPFNLVCSASIPFEIMVTSLSLVRRAISRSLESMSGLSLRLSRLVGGIMRHYTPLYTLLRATDESVDPLMGRSGLCLP